MWCIFMLYICQMFSVHGRLPLQYVRRKMVITDNVVLEPSGTQARQTGNVYRGPGAAKRVLPRLDSYQEECLRKAKKYAMEQNVNITSVRETIFQQQQVQFEHEYPCTATMLV